MGLSSQEGLPTQLGVRCEPKWDTLSLSIFVMWRLGMKTAGSRITEVRNSQTFSVFFWVTE
jgi:hypothetical protein